MKVFDNLPILIITIASCDRGIKGRAPEQTAKLVEWKRAKVIYNRASPCLVSRACRYGNARQSLMMSRLQSCLMQQTKRARNGGSRKLEVCSGPIHVLTTKPSLVSPSNVQPQVCSTQPFHSNQPIMFNKQPR